MSDSTVSLYWDPANMPTELSSKLSVLADYYPLHEGPTGSGRQLVFQASDNPEELTVSVAGDRVVVRYGSVSAALRGVGHALAGENRSESSSFTSLGIMLDCSRHAVMKPEYVKRWLRQLALLGYNNLMLYTEDVYRLPNEPLFGYKRGAYTADEVKEIDSYAASLGIEVIACIQTLGHLEQMLKWDAYKNVADTEFNVRVDRERTYELIDKMLRFWSEALSTRRIHVGMDEATHLGRGKYMNDNGYTDPFELLSKHLERVSAMCEGYGLKPMIWSDMYFRLGSATHDYYDRNSVIPDGVKKRIPANVDLVYWDYCTTDEDFYCEWIQRHRSLGKEPIMASGIWTWLRVWYDHNATQAAVGPCVRACRKTGVKELWFTMWGDGGSCCEFDSAFAGIAYSADISFGGSGDDSSVAPIFRAVCGGDYKLHLLGTELISKSPKSGAVLLPTTPIWDDAFLGIAWEGYLEADDNYWDNFLTKMRNLRQQVEPHRQDCAVADFNYLWAIINAIIHKVELRKAILAAYPNDRAALQRIRDEQIPATIQSIRELELAFRTQWMRRNKVFGMEPTQVRFGGVRARLEECARRIGEFLDGTIDGIEELDTKYDPVGINPVSYFVWLISGSVRI